MQFKAKRMYENVDLAQVMTKIDEIHSQIKGDKNIIPDRTCWAPTEAAKEWLNCSDEILNYYRENDLIDFCFDGIDNELHYDLCSIKAPRIW